MKKKIIIATLVPLFILPFVAKISPSQSFQIINQSNQLVNNTFNLPIQQKSQIKPDYIKVIEITGWNIEIAKYFVSEANNRNVSIFDEILPIIFTETGGTYDFNLIHYNSNGTKDVGIFQINNITKSDIIKLLKVEGREFKSWSRLNPEFNISEGMCWLNYLKSKELENHSLFTSYNYGINGAKNYASRNGTYVSRYSRDVIKARNEINNVINK